MALPTYATTGQRIGYYSYLTYCGLVFFFLVYLSLSSSPKNLKNPILNYLIPILINVFSLLNTEI